MGKKTVSKANVSKTGRAKPSSPPTPGNKGGRYGCGGKIKK